MGAKGRNRRSKQGAGVKRQEPSPQESPRESDGGRGTSSPLGPLEGEFRIIRELGRGGSAVVYLAWEEALERELALKVIRSGFAEDEEAAARLEREARTLARMRHPKIVSLYGTRRLGDGRVALLMQHVPGRTLRAELTEAGALPFHRVEQVLRDVAEALAHAHRRRIVHRDVKPENIYIDEESGLAMLSDFGIARPWDAEFGLTVAGATLGTPAYMSPEQVDGRGVDGRTDLYSLGMVAYEMVAGRHPWAGESIFSLILKQKQEEPPPLAHVRPDTPEHLERVVQGLLHKEPADRWQSADEVLEALDRGRLTSTPRVPRQREGSGPGHPVWPAPEDPGAPLVPAGPSVEETLATLRADGVEGVSARREEPLPASAEAGWETDDETDPDEGVEEPPRRRFLRFGTLAAAVVLAVLLLAADAVRLAVGDLDQVDPVPPVVERTLETGAPLPTESAEPAPEPTTPAPQPYALSAAGGDAQSGAPGEPLSEALGVRVVDDRGEPLAGVEIEFRTLQGGGEVRPSSVRTDEDGRAQAVWVLGEEAGSGLAVATVVGAPDLTARFTARGVLPAPARAELEGDRQRGEPGTALAQPVVLRIVDESGRGVPDLDVRFEAANGGRVSPETAVTDVDGRVRAAWSLGPSAGEHRLLVHVPDLPGSPLALTATAEPPPVPTRPGLALGGTHTCTLRPGGDALCWGGNPDGQLGGGRAGGGGPSVVAVQAGSPLALLAPGVSHTCALTRSGVALCWGGNDAGQLGDASTTPRGEPVAVRTDARFVVLAAGVAHTCGLDVSGQVLCWGDNRRGQLGDGTGTPRRTPVTASPGRAYRALAVGWFHTCAIDRAGETLCWGANDSGQLGSGAAGRDRSPGVPVAGRQRFVELAAGSEHTCGLTGDGSVHCWGGNNHGQLGDGTVTTRGEPVRVAAQQRFTAITAGAAHTCALAEDGSAYCWGRNTFGQLGDGGTGNARGPVPVAGGLRFLTLHASGAHTCGTASDGARYCWGYNLDGQLGDGTRTHRNRPVRVTLQ